MRLRVQMPVFFALAAASAWAQLQPTIAPRSMVNAASLTPASIPGGSIAQGSIFSIFGTNLGPANPLTQTNFPLDTQLGGIVVRVIQGTTTLNAIPIYASATRIDAIMPSNAPLGMVSVQAANGVVRGNMAPVRVTDASFGIYTINQIGFGPGQVMNLNDDGSAAGQNTAASPAVQGQTIQLIGSGLGANGDFPPVTVEVFVGGEASTVVSSGRSGDVGGQDQITFQIPDDALLGCYVPVMVRLNGTVPSNTATIAISSDGSACADAVNPFSNAIITGGKLAFAVALRSSVREDVGTLTPTDVVSDNAAIYLRSESGGSLAFNPVFSLPPPGSCITQSGAGDWFTRSAIPGTEPSAGYLKGPANFSVTGQGSGKSAPLAATGLGMAKVGSRISIFAKVPSTIFLGPGNTVISAGATPTVGGISTTISMPPVPNWSNRDQITNIDRTMDLTVNFDGIADGQTVMIVGGAVDVPTYSTALFACVAPPGATSFTVPAPVLAAIPASRRLPIQTKGVLYVGTASVPTTFTATNIDFGIGIGLALNGKTVVFK